MTSRTPAKRNEGGSNGDNNATMDDLDSLFHLRGIAKGKVTRVKNLLEQAEADETEMTPPQIKVFSRKLEAAYREFHDYHERIVAATTPSRRKDQECKYLEFELIHDQVSLSLETWFEKFANPTAPTTQTLGNTQPVVIQHSLPRAIPNFDGRYEQWNKFKIMFKDVVDRSNDAPRIKLYHLEKALIGDAAGIIDAKTISDGNYDRAWEILEGRFEDKRRMVDLHISGLLNLSKVSKEGHAELRKLVDTCTGHVENLKFLGQEFYGLTELIVIHLLTNALDNESKKLWESTVGHGELPVYDDTISFLKSRISVLERCSTSIVESTPKQSSRPLAKGLQGAQQYPKTNVATAASNCEFCSGDHMAFKCSEFIGLTVAQRLELVRKKNVCFNCLRLGHRGTDCLSKKSCSKCNRRHHTLLHGDNGPTTHGAAKSNTATTDLEKQQQPTTAVQPESDLVSITAAHSKISDRPTKQIFLLTALVNVLDKHGCLHPCRALLDSGSQVNFISQSLVNKLQVGAETVDVPIAGVNGVRSNARQRSMINVRSRQGEFSFEMSCLVAPKVTGMIPCLEINVAQWKIPPGIQLADPSFYKPGQIDMLIGMEWYYDLMKPGQLRLSDSLPILHDSQFGWLVGGKTDGFIFSGATMYSHITASADERLSEQVQRFWELESISSEVNTSYEADQCEQHFRTTFRRETDGRYVVQLPLKDNAAQLGDSRQLALRRFYSLEGKLNRQPELKQQYSDFIEEYERLGHCKEVKEDDDGKNVRRWYLPHHAVIKPSNSTTRCRVVFDASAKVSGISLNDAMMIGPTIQPDLFTIILRFRKHRYVLSADIAKMYRQILVDKCHTPLQRILWRRNPSDPIRTLELQTVTYGTAAAPFLAIRTLEQLAMDEAETHPLAATVVKDAFYVDNALFGGDDLDEVALAQRELISLLKLGGMHLHKWAANDDRLLTSISIEDQDKMVKVEDSSANEAIKTLGLLWDPFGDYFLFLAQPPPQNEIPTKRKVLSVIARLFDPLGLLSPVIVLAKILMQNLWKSKLKWDDELAGDVLQYWKSFLCALPSDGQFRIPRQILTNHRTAVEMHGFSDASNAAYGAVIYLRSMHNDGTACMNLVTSKSKVCPISPLTIPRKELMAALLLFRLTKKVIAALNLTYHTIILWIDSQIVLAWLKMPFERLPVFIRNRVAEIRSDDRFVWKYVPSAENPADIVSRGMPSEALARNNLWWHGPLYLRTSDYTEENPAELGETEIPELIPELLSNIATTFEELPILTKFESFRKTQRIIAYVLRFISNCRVAKSKRILNTYPTVPELREATKAIVKSIQQQELFEEIQRIEAGEPCKRIGNLNPFLDDGILRVGGRIRHSKLRYELKHQWVLPDKHPVTPRLIAAFHKENLHAGPSTVISAIRQQFWLLNARSAVRKVTRSCITCFKTNPRLADQFMGDLPSYRTNMAPTFLKVGVDFAGPIYVKQRGRKAPPLKGYICVFVCMVSKAIHLEPVEDLSTGGFMAALQRFVSRRGVPEEIFSDNGTNFIGARSELHELYKLFQSDVTQARLSQFCQTTEITWTTIPPSAPHFGGLWEAGVKSVKSVLKKVYQSASLTILEFATLLCQVEAILNSRPLFAHSSDPNDPEVLTPGHLLIDRPLTAIPEPLYTDIPINRLSRWQHIQQLRQHFWKRWSKEYLVELQARAKWTKKKVNIEPGVVVLIKEDNVPPQQWRIGKVITTYPGPDGLTRVVDVRTSSAVFKRPIHKLAPLPILDNIP